MPKFLIWQGSQYVSATQRSRPARICFYGVLNKSSVLNTPGFGMWYGSEYVWVTQGSTYAIIRLKMPE